MPKPTEPRGLDQVREDVAREVAVDAEAVGFATWADVVDHAVRRAYYEGMLSGLAGVEPFLCGQTGLRGLVSRLRRTVAKARREGMALRGGGR